MIKVITDISEFRSLRQQWETLAERFKNPLLSHTWVSSAVEAELQAQLAIVIVHDGTTIRAAAPLVAVKRAGVKVYRNAGYWIGEPSGILYDSAESCRELMTGLAHRKRAVILHRLPLDDDIKRSSDPLMRQGAVRYYQEMAPSNYVAHREGWEKLLSVMGAKAKSAIRRKHKLAEKCGKVEFAVCHLFSKNIDQHLDEMFALELAGWKGRLGTAISQNAQMERFYRSYSKEATRQGILRLFRLSIAGKTAALSLAIEHSKRLWGLKICYDEQWRTSAPGLLLSHETLRWGCEHGVEAFEFLGHAEAWQQQWKPEQRNYFNVGLYPLLSLSGTAALTQDIGRDSLKKVRAKIGMLRRK